MDQWLLIALESYKNKIQHSKFLFRTESENQGFSVTALNEFLIICSHRAESAKKKKKKELAYNPMA